MMKNYLPIGTVAVFKGCLRPVMIIGYMIYNDGSIKDYVATIYPEGYLGKETIMCFDHRDIKIVVAMGYIDRYYERFIKKLNEIGEE